MTLKLKLGDPERVDYIAAQRRQIRERVSAALASEKTSASDDVVCFVAEAAWRLSCGAHPFPLVQQVTPTVNMLRSLSTEGVRLASATNKIVEQINSCHMDTHEAIREELIARGITEETFSLVLEALKAAGDKIATTPVPGRLAAAVRQGNTQSPRIAWAILMWRCLNESIGLGMRPASRVIATAFDEGANEAKSIYQAIRNSRVG